MGSKRAILFTLTLSLPSLAPGYSGVADVTLSWGVGGSVVSWSSTGQNALAIVGNSSRLTLEPGSNGTSYFNSDFATGSNYGSGTTDDCLTLLSGYDSLQLRKYGCQQRDSSNGNIPLFHPSPPADAGPAAAAVGTLNFTDTTLTGTLSVVATTDEPTGGDESSTGNGAGGFNVRALDGSAYGNAWYGVSTAATLTVDLTGTFTAAGWEITGGTVRLSDPAFQCQQGGIGGVAPDFVLCQVSAVQGGLSADGSNLSFGVDVDGGAPGMTMAELQIRDTAGTGIVASLSGVLASLTVSAGGSLGTEFGEFRAGAGTGTGGCQGQVRWDGSKITCGTLTAGDLQITGTATPMDTEPDPFVFTDITGVSLGTLVTSNTVAIAGIAAPARITVAGGQYSIGCSGTFTSAAGNIPDGSGVCVRHTSSANPGADTVTTLNIGGIAGTFTSTTMPADTTPDPFAFADQTDVAASTEVISASVTITGINGATTVSVTGGEYSVGCNGAFTAAAGSINPSQAVCVRHTSSSVPLTGTSTTLTVGGVSGMFTSTTTAGPDTTPDAFSFVDQTGVPLSSTITSAAVTISGIDGPVTVSIAGGSYSVGCTAAFIVVPRVVVVGQTVCVRQTSAATPGTQTPTTLTVGDVSDTFVSTTVGALPDTTPDAFSFVDQTGVPVATTITSSAVTITGIDAPAAVSLTGGAYSVGCTVTYVSTPGSVANNQTICVRHTSASADGASSSTILSVGGVTDTFTSTTVSATLDTTPAPFNFINQTGVPVSSSITSAPVTITDIDVPAAVSVSGGVYSVGCTATYVSTPGSVSNNQTICVRHTSAAENSSQTSTTLTVGGVADTFSSTTVPAAGGGGGGGGGGGAPDLLVLSVLAGLPVWRRRRASKGHIVIQV